MRGRLLLADILRAIPSMFFGSLVVVESRHFEDTCGARPASYFTADSKIILTVILTFRESSPCLVPPFPGSRHAYYLDIGTLD